MSEINRPELIKNLKKIHTGEVTNLFSINFLSSEKDSNDILYKTDAILRGLLLETIYTASLLATLALKDDNLLTKFISPIQKFQKSGNGKELIERIQNLRTIYPSLNIKFYYYKSSNVVGYYDNDRTIYVNITAFYVDYKRYTINLIHELLHYYGYTHGTGLTRNYISPRFLYGWKLNSQNYLGSELLGNGIVKTLDNHNIKCEDVIELVSEDYKISCP